jgi:serine/threonine-protein kinase
MAGDLPRVKRHTKNLEAYNLYLKGRYFFAKFTAESSSKSRECFEQAIALDPDYALAWSGLADLYQVLGNIGLIPPKEAYAQCRQAVTKALELDERLPEARGEMGVLRAEEFDWKEAEREFKLALEIGSTSWDVLTKYSLYFLLPLGRLEEALDVSRKALELDPFAPITHRNLAAAYLIAGEYRQAIDQLKHALLLDPHYWSAHSFLGSAYTRIEKYDEAIKASETAAQLTGRHPYALGYLGYAYAISGRANQAYGILEELEELDRKSYVMPSAFARIYLGLGQIDKYFDWLEKAVNEFDAVNFLIAHNVPTLDPLRSHPRYKALLRKMNLEP